MTKEEIIARLEDLARDAKRRIDPEDPEDVFRKDHEALTEAVEILKGERKKVALVMHSRVTHIQEDAPWCEYGFCDNCGAYIQAWNFCPNCGAKMDLEE